MVVEGAEVSFGDGCGEPLDLRARASVWRCLAQELQALVHTGAQMMAVRVGGGDESEEGQQEGLRAGRGHMKARHADV
eukprot:3086375-Rhodomonas_salina.2